MQSRPTVVFVALGVAVATSAFGCGGGGGGSDYKNNPRPSSPITVTASISDRSVSVSPARFGAGPVSVTVANLTDAAQTVTLETDTGASSSAPGVKQKTAPISPRDTATLQLSVTPGRYTVHVEGGGIRAAKINVGKQRSSAQNDLLLP